MGLRSAPKASEARSRERRERMLSEYRVWSIEYRGK
jgi:hypothetical protein